MVQVLNVTISDHNFIFSSSHRYMFTSASFAFFARKEVKGFWACGRFLDFRLWQVLKWSKEILQY